ncbi:MAG TPA: hypothetical protein VGE30_00360 [Candidatus Saccharimonadales bacterium]
MEESTGRGKQIVITLAVLVVLLITIAAAVVAGQDNNAMNDSGGSSTPTTSQTVDPNTTYADGTYEATGNYMTPGGTEKIAVSITVKNGVITATSATNEATDIEAKDHQQDFIGHYKSEVVGKKLSEISLDRISGSSLTAQGFNDAIQQIRNKAEV